MKVSEKRMAECVFDLTLIANHLLGLTPDHIEVDSRAVFEEIWILAGEFESELKDSDDYMTKIEEFGLEKLAEFFGMEDL